jgi:hypothetical protein
MLAFGCPVQRTHGWQQGRSIRPFSHYSHKNLHIQEQVAANSQANLNALRIRLGKRNYEAAARSFTLRCGFRGMVNAIPG